MSEIATNKVTEGWCPHGVYVAQKPRVSKQRMICRECATERIEELEAAVAELPLLIDRLDRIEKKLGIFLTSKLAEVSDVLLADTDWAAMGDEP